MDWWKGLKREDTGNPGEDISTISKTVRYFKKWDSEKQIAYFGEQDQNGSLVAEETDTSFLENLSDLEGHYVLAETRAREDEFIGPDTLLSIKPVETNVGTVTSANAERITIGNDAYSTPEWLLQPDSYEKKFVLYHIYEEKIVGIETLKTEKGTLTQWNADTRAVTIDPEGADKDACVYTLSTLADDETLTRLGETGQKQIVVHYIADSNHFLYRVKLLPVSISYSSDYVRETEDSITYTIQIEATNNNTEAALTDVFIKMGVGNDSVLLDDDPVQEKSTLAAGEKMTAEYTVRLDKKTYTDGSKYYFTVSAGAAGVETASENGSVQVKYRNQKPDVWSIANSDGTYWGNRGYYITRNDYERLLSNLPATSRERFNFIIEFEAIKNQYGISQMKAVNRFNVDGEAEKGTYAKWGGSCYGLSAWVCLVASGIRSAADISKAAATLVGASALASNRDGSGEDEKFNALTSVEVADSVVKIDKRAFFDCPALQSVTIGAGVTAIGDYVFSYDNALSQIRVSGDNPFFKSENNILFSKDGRVLYRYPHNTDASYTIPKLTEVIAVDAFDDCTALTKITIPTSVTEIKTDAFDGCSSLTDVYYDGSKSDWNAIVIESNNDALTGATIHFGLPSEEIKSLTDCSVMLDCYSYTYHSKGKKTTVTVKDGSTTLTSGKDYEVTYADNTDAGTAEVTITGKGDYFGSVTKEFTIQKANQTLSASISASSILVGGTAQITASAKTGMSYSSSDTKVAAVSASGVVTAKAVGTATITVTAKASKNYNEASKNVTVTVTEKSVPVTKKLSACKVTLAKTSYTYDGKAKKPAVTVKDGSTTLTNGKDYEVSYANNTNAGTATVTVTGKGNYTGIKKVDFAIKKTANEITAANVTKVASAKAQSFSIGAKVKGGAKLTYKSNNKSITVDKNGKVTIAKNFVGKATITITAAATKNYNAGTKKVTVTVNPASTKLSSVKNSASKSMKVTWKKNAAVTGYQVQYATAKNFKGAKAVTVKKAKTTSVTIKKLAKGKKYYVRVRTYQKVSGKTYYSAWSASKNVTIKK